MNPKKRLKVSCCDASPKSYLLDYYPICIKGKRACPPEDCGGSWGYPEFLEAIQTPTHPEHESMLEWVGGEFDPEEFDLDEVNETLKQLD